MTKKLNHILQQHANLTEAELAERVGMSVQTYHYKLRRNSFTIQDLEKIAIALRCELTIEFVDNVI